MPTFTEPTSTEPASTDPTSTRFGVDLSRLTGAVHGGATGMLYGLSDVGVPADQLIAGARPRTMAQRAPAGRQHPNGDALVTSTAFFAAGGHEMLIYMQDAFAQWPYENPGIDEYLRLVTDMVTTVSEDANAERFSWVPFNEPDWIWYPDWAQDRDRFLADWQAVTRAIRSVLPKARIVGPNEREYNRDRLDDFLRWASAHDVLPDVMSWHELEPASLVDYPSHHRDYRALEASIGIGPLPINIDEYANRRDTSNPGQMIQWISMFEDTKVDADIAYWTYAGNLDDHAVQTAQANGGWWLLKWYADLTGQTAATTSASPSGGGPGRRGIAALDGDRREAVVLVGGGPGSLTLDVEGLSAPVFGDTVDVSVSKTTWSGYEGDAGCPPVVQRSRLTVRDGAVSIPIADDDPMAVHRVAITPPEADVVRTRAAWSTRHEAEDALLSSATVVVQDDDAQKQAASGGRDVAGLTRADSSVTFTVEVPSDGQYRLGVFYATNGAPARHALWLDDVFHGELRYPATLHRAYRGRLDHEVVLAQGRHRLSLRVGDPLSTQQSAPQSAPDGEVTLDRLDVTRIDGPESSTYPARGARLSAGATLCPGGIAVPAQTVLPAGERATFFVAAAATGYYDVTTTFAASADCALVVTVNGRTVQEGSASGAGACTATARVHLARGVSAIQVGAVAGEARVTAVRLERASTADASTVTFEARDAVLTGTATLVADDHAPGGAYLDALGAGPNTATFPRGLGGSAGPSNVTVSYANAAKQGAHEYNTDVVSLFATISEAGGGRVTAAFRHSYAWNNFWDLVLPLDLCTERGALTIANPADRAPNVARVAVSPLVLTATIRPAAQPG